MDFRKENAQKSINKGASETKKHINEIKELLGVKYEVNTRNKKKSKKN